MKYLFFLLVFSIHMVTAQNPAQWSAQKANEWYAQQPWLTGANFLPSTAINQLEMWQEDSFDTSTINRELGWAESIGFNTLRVFLHNVVWLHDAIKFKERINQFLQITALHKIKPIFVFFLQKT